MLRSSVPFNLLLDLTFMSRRIIRKQWQSNLALLALGITMFAPELFAFQPCPLETQPCASPFQVLLLVVFPSLLYCCVAVFVKRKTQRVWLRRGALLLVAGLWLISLLVVYAAFSAFLAPCSGSCWYDIPR